MKKSTILKDTLILTAITLISGLLLGLVYQITKDPIAEQKEMFSQMRILLNPIFRRRMPICLHTLPRMATQRRPSMK